MVLKIMKSRISALSTSDVKVVQLNPIRNHLFLILCWEIKILEILSSVTQFNA